VTITKRLHHPVMTESFSKRTAKIFDSVCVDRRYGEVRRDWQHCCPVENKYVRDCRICQPVNQTAAKTQPCPPQILPKRDTGSRDRRGKKKARHVVLDNGAWHRARGKWMKDVGAPRRPR